MHLDAVVVQHRRMVFQLCVDVWGQKTGNFWPHTMLKKQTNLQTQIKAGI